MDDTEADLFNVADAQGLDGHQATVADRQGLAFCRAVLRADGPSTVRLESRVALPIADRHRIRDTAAVRATAVHTKEVEQRRQQAAFRARVGAACGWACVVTGETERAVLDAAHLPGSSWRSGDNAASDGVMLRADLHRLLDAGLLGIEQGVVRVSTKSYGALNGKIARMPLAPNE